MRSASASATVIVALALLQPAMASPALPARNDLAWVLKAYRSAQGVWAPGRPQTRSFQWTLVQGGLRGTETHIVSGSDERIDTTLGPSTLAEGTIGGVSWSMNANAEVVVDSGIHRSLAIDDAALRAATGARGPTRGVRLAGHVLRPVDEYDVQVDPPGGVLEDLYINARTWTLDRRVVRYPGRTVMYAYDDYRTTLGIRFAWHVHESIDGGRQEIDLRLQDVALGSPVDPSRLAMPQNRSIVSFAKPRSSLPGEIVGDRIIIPVQIGSRTVNLQLDSGAGGIAIDRGIVRALGYAEYGRVTEETAGPYVESSAVIPSIVIGPLTMHDVHVESIPFGSLAGNYPIAGLLGFDFIDCVVLHIDYADGTVEAIDPNAFTQPAGTVSLPIALDDGVPAIDARIGSASGLRFLVDTGADRSLLFSSFAKNHANVMLDRGLGTEMEAASPFLGHLEGVGGRIQYRPVQLGPLTVASWTFSRWLFYMTLDPSSFEIQDYDGILGQDLLRYYDLYLDYPHRRILFAPNARYAQRFAP
ncbi:MAG: aspartyl protease family protein [Candidatus Tyrphobacter sp.]